MVWFVAKHTDDAVESSRTWIRNSSLGKETLDAVDYMLKNFGDLPLKQTEALGRAIKGLNAYKWTEIEKKGLHRLIGGFPDAQGDLAIVSMKDAGIWSDQLIKEAIELGDDGSKLKNFTKNPKIGGKTPDGLFVLQQTEYVIESSKIEKTIAKEGNLKNFLKNKVDEEYSQLDVSEMAGKDASIIIGLQNGLEEGLTMSNIKAALDELVTENRTSYQYLSRVIIRDEITEVVIKTVK